jgi:hypothetical protein
MPDSVPPGTKVSLDEKPELGGVCMKAVFEKDVWFGDTRPRDWSGIANNDGSAADLSLVRILTVSCGADSTVLFGDFILE